MAANIPALSEERLRATLVELGEDFRLDPATAWSARSNSGRLLAAGVHHSEERSGARRYLDRGEQAVTWFDGLPVFVEGEATGADAASLTRHWDSLEQGLEGQFNVARLDLREDRFELLLDALGLLQVFRARRAGGVLISNSATAIASLLDLRSPDPLGVSSFMGLGWAAGESTLTEGIDVLAGGARHVVESGELRTERSFGPQTIAGGPRRRIPQSELAERMTVMTGNAVRGMERVGCALTAGRDTRILLALLLAAGEDALYFTGGMPTTPDVQIATEIAEALGLKHEVVMHDPVGGSLDWTIAAALFMRQNDGLSSLLQIGDYIDLTAGTPPLGVKLWGVGGEIGRAGTGELTAIATNMPLLRSSRRVQDKLLEMKGRDEGGIMTPEARELLLRYLERFQAERVEEGWRTAELQEAFYMFERVGRWGATGPRRMAGTDDIFTPFSSRVFIDYCFAMSSGERLVEAAHYRLLSELSHTLREHRYEKPFPTPRAWQAPALASKHLARAVRRRLRNARRARDSSGAGFQDAAPNPEYYFQHLWFEARLDLIRELFDSPAEELWQYISRPRVEHLMRAGEAERAYYQEVLLRATTVFWHFHGLRPSDARARALASSA